MAKLAAGVRRRANGALERRFTVNGTRYSVYGHSQHEINEKEQKLRVQLAMNGGNNSKGVLLEDYFEEWLDEKRLTVKSNTIRTYLSYYHPYIAPVFGKQLLSQIDRKQVLSFQKNLTERLEANTNNITITVLKIILNSAVKEGLLAKNPAADIKRIRPQKRASESYHRALSEEEQAIFMKGAKNNFYFELLAFQLLTGMRLGEIGALHWSDIDWSTNVIRITKTITCTEDCKKYIGDSPKSESSNRQIPINRQIRQVLELLKHKQYRIKSEENKELVFKTPFRKLVDNRSVNSAIHTICKELEQEGYVIARFTSHALRDTFATRYIEQGGSPQTLKTILGHASLSMTMDLYSHVMPNTRQEEMNRIEMDVGFEHQKSDVQTKI